MMLSELTNVPAAALPVAAFKDHLRLGSGFADDGLQDDVLAGFLRAAMAAIEARTGKILIERDFSWIVTAWRDERRQPLPLAPISALVRMVLVDRDGIETDVPNTRYHLMPDDQRPAVVATTGSLPAMRTNGHVRVEMLAGYGPEWTDLPADLQQAVMMLAAHFYEHRHDTRAQSGIMPFGVTSLIERYRTVRIFLGGRS